MAEQLTAEDRARHLRAWLRLNDPACHDFLTGIMAVVPDDDYFVVGSSLSAMCYSLNKAVLEDGKPLPDEVVAAWVTNTLKSVPDEVLPLRDWAAELRGSFDAANHCPREPFS